MRSLSQLARVVLATLRAVVLSFLPGRRLDNWGGTDEEVRHEYRGDEVLPDPITRFIRAISVQAAPEEVWPWVAQIGRGAGYYSYDVLDNGGRPSAEHVLEVPPPVPGDRNEAIGDVIHVEPGREIVWKREGERFFGATVDLVLDYLVLPGGDGGTRVVALILGGGRGGAIWLVKWVFRVMDYVMAPEQLRGLRLRAEGRMVGEVVEGCGGPAEHQRDGIEFARTS